MDLPEDSSVVHRNNQVKAAKQSRTFSFSAERTKLRQQKFIGQIKRHLEDAGVFLLQLDTLSQRQRLDHYAAIDSTLRFEVDGILSSTESYRNVATLSRAWTGLHRRVSVLHEDIVAISNELGMRKYVLDSLASDSVVFGMMQGKASDIIHASGTITALSDKFLAVDSSLSVAAIQVEFLVNRSELLLAEISSRINLMEERQRRASAATFDREVPDLWMTNAQSYSSNLLLYSVNRTGLALSLYLQNNAATLLLLLATVVISSIFLFALRNILKQENLLHEPEIGQLVLRYPVLSAMIISISSLQFAFPNPPTAITVLFTTVSAVSLTFVFSGVIHKIWMRLWIILLILLVYSSFINLTLPGSTMERWAMVSGAIIGVVVPSRYLMRHKALLTDQRLKYFIVLLVLLEFLSLFANLCGRYNLAKNLFTTGFLSIVVGVIFLWTVRFINEGLELSYHVYTLKDRKLFNINFEKVGTTAPRWLYWLLAIGWTVVVLRNFYIYRLVSDPLRSFVLQPRSIGDYTFSFGGMLLFILIMFVAVVVSRIVSFFASDRPQTTGNGAGLGSLLLLVRIGIFSIGLFLAFAATGIPLDKLTIILGALSVGIGFGLQALVNNLVSGLILAFERPINVGDIVEVDGRIGTMKSIGFRSSRIATGDGADLIMPNGDLLGHLINWTAGDTRRKMELSFGVAYGSDLTKVERIVRDILLNEQRIVKYPEPVVLFEGFGESAIGVNLHFWVGHFKERMAVRSLIVLAIDSAFRDAKIIIPYPHINVYIEKQRNT